MYKKQLMDLFRETLIRSTGLPAYLVNASCNRIEKEFKEDNTMVNFVNNKPKFKVGDKVVYSRRRDDPAHWEIESIAKGPLTIKKVDTFYTNDELIRVDYFVEGLNYVYSEDWLSYASAGPKFKIGDKVQVYLMGCLKGCYRVEDVLTVRHQKDGHEEYFYKIPGWTCNFSERDLKREVINEEEQLIHDLEICGRGNGCTGCSREEPDNRGLARGCCDKINLDAAELIKKLQKRVKELEEEKK